MGLNPDLPTSYQRPGTYVYPSRAGSAPPADNRRVCILGYKTSAGAIQNDSAQRITSEDDAVYYGGKGSDAVDIFRAFTSCAKSGAELWMVCPPTPSGTAQTVKLTVMAAPSAGALDAVSTAAAAAGVLSVWICGYAVSVTVASGDTYATIATNLRAEILKIEDYLPCTSGISTATITLTARHAAVTSQDMPVRVNVSNTSMSIAVSCGTLTYASNAGATGTSNLLTTLRSVSASVTNGDTANAIAAAMVTAINAASAYPLIAAQTAPSAVVTLFCQNDRTVNRITHSFTTVTTTTATFSFATGAGLPSLTNTITHLQSQPAFRLIVTNLTDFDVGTPVYTPTGTLSSHIESEGSGLIQKGQILVFASTLKLTTAGALPAGSSPALTLSPRYFMGWAIGAIPLRACQSAARIAAAVINHLDYPPYNYSGTALTTSGSVPMLLTEPADLPSGSDINSAMVSYYMTPLVANVQNQLIIESGRTTAKPSSILDGDYRWWGTALVDDVVRDDLRLQVPALVANKSIKAHGDAHTSNVMTPEGLRGAIWSRVLYYDAQDWFDGMDGLKDAMTSVVNAVLPSRIDVTMPKRFVVPLEQVSIVTQKAV